MNDNNEYKKVMFNTTVDANALNKFRDYCKKMNCPMNTVVQAFMEAFADGKFVLSISKNKSWIDTEDNQ